MAFEKKFYVFDKWHFNKPPSNYLVTSNILELVESPTCWTTLNPVGPLICDLSIFFFLSFPSDFPTDPNLLKSVREENMDEFEPDVEWFDVVLFAAGRFRVMGWLARIGRLPRSILVPPPALTPAPFPSDAAAAAAAFLEPCFFVFERILFITVL